MAVANIYRDISKRTNGDIYIGIVGPVRTGKSTFIKSFMDNLVLPNISDENKKLRAQDELPQSAGGRTIMTTEPKFIPNEAVEIKVGGVADMRVRMIDCVGYMADGALGNTEDGFPRMVKTPWFAEEIPFDKAAEIGTQKVVRDHSTIAFVVTTDGSITDLPRQSYLAAEERVIGELSAINKPFVILLNSISPDSDECLKLKNELESKYAVPVIPVSCADMRASDINNIIENILFEFPLSEISIAIPSWMNSIDDSHYIKTALYDTLDSALDGVSKISDLKKLVCALGEFEYAKYADISKIDLGTGCATINLTGADGLFYKILSEDTGFDIKNECDLMNLIKSLAVAKRNYDKLEYALHQVAETGYGIVSPSMEELTLEEPEIVKHGGKFGVRLHASAPSIHMIRADIETEVSPVVGTEKQSEDLLEYLLSEFEVDPQKIWQSNFFGKTLHELVNEDLHGKLGRMPEEAQQKMRQTLEKIINEGSGGLICIIL